MAGVAHAAAVAEACPYCDEPGCSGFHVLTDELVEHARLRAIRAVSGVAAPVGPIGQAPQDKPTIAAETAEGDASEAMFLPRSDRKRRHHSQIEDAVRRQGYWWPDGS